MSSSASPRSGFYPAPDDSCAGLSIGLVRSFACPFLNLLQVVYLHLNKRLSLSLTLPRRFPRTRRRSAGEIFGVSLAAVIVVVVSAATSIPVFGSLRRSHDYRSAGELTHDPGVRLPLPSVVRGHRDSAAGWAIVASLSRWVPSPQPFVAFSCFSIRSAA